MAQIDRTYFALAGARASLRRALTYSMFEGRPATTRGQWFNPVVRAHLRVGPRLTSGPIDRPIFVLGVGRSGTTHLGRLLSAHRDVGWLNEPKLLWNLVLPNEDVSGFYGRAGRFALDAGDATESVRERSQRSYAYYLRVVRATRLVEKYPELTYRIPFLKAMFPDARLLAIVRRPEDFVNSVLDWNQRNAVGREDWWGVERKKWHQYVDQLVRPDDEVAPLVEEVELAGRALGDHEMASVEWVVGMRALIAARDHLDLVLRFEDLAQNPGGAMSEVLAAADLPTDGRVQALASSTTSGRLRQEPAQFGAMDGLIATTRRILTV